MKKTMCLIIAVIMIAALAACGNNAGGQGNNTPTEKGDANDNNQSSYGEKDLGLIFEATIEETVLVDEKDVKITAKELSYSGSSAELSLLIENNSNLELSFYAGTVGCPMNSVNGYMIPDGYLAEDVAAGMTANETMRFSLDQLALYGFKDIADIGVGFEIKTEDYDEYLLTGSIEIRTSASDGYDYSRDTFAEAMDDIIVPAVYGFTVDYRSDEKIYDDPDISILNEYLVTNKDGEKALFMEIINKSEEGRYASTEDIAINGVAVSSLGEVEYLAPGKRCVMSISLDSLLSSEYMERMNMENYSYFESYFGVKDEDYVELTGKGIRIDFDNDVSPLDFEDSIVYEANGFKFMEMGLVMSVTDYADDINVLVLVKNDSGKKVTIDDGYNDVYVNKMKIASTCYSQTAIPGGYALMDIELQGYNLEKNGLDDLSAIKEITITFEIEDENYDTVDEPTITLTY